MSLFDICIVQWSSARLGSSQTLLDLLPLKWIKCVTNLFIYSFIALSYTRHHVCEEFAVDQLKSGDLDSSF